MGSLTATRHSIDFGESVAWTPPAGAAAFYVWAKTVADDEAMRWRRLAGWNVTNNTAVTIPDAPGSPTLALSGAEVALTWTELLDIFDGYDNELLALTAHDAAGAMIRRDVFLLPAPTATNAATIAAQERRVLAKLLKRRATTYDVAGVMRVSSADGSSLERETMAALDRRIAEVRARVVWFEAAAAGNALPRAEFW